MEIIIHCILSVFFGYSFAVLIVEKGDDWPVIIFTKPLKYLFGKIYNKLPQMLECTVCASFWTTLIGEIFLKLWVTSLFLWPFTGVITVGTTWFIIELLNSLDKTNIHEKPN